MYFAGFPCKAFSFLSKKTALLEDERAKPLFATIDTIKKTKPLVVILENVVGFDRVWTEASKMLLQCGPYMMEKVTICPSALGAPCSRRRIYILMVREDILSSDITCKKAFTKSVRETLEKLKHPAPIPFEKLLYPPGHPVLQAHHACLLSLCVA